MGNYSLAVLLLVGVVVINVVVADEETVVELTKEDFDGRDTAIPMFIKFYAPW